MMKKNTSIFHISQFLSLSSGIEAILNSKALQSYQSLDSNLYRCMLPQVKLLNFEVAPVIDLQLNLTAEDCSVEMVSCKFEGSDVAERQNEHFSASMQNNIKWETIASETFLDVDVRLNLVLEGETGKMNASVPSSAIYVTDSAKDIKNKINKYAFSGGQDSIENHRKHGANLEVDIPVKYLGFFMEDDAELEHVRTEYGAGRMLTGEVKKRLTDVLTELVERHRRARAAVTDEMVDAFMAVRPLPNMFS